MTILSRTHRVIIMITAIVCMIGLIGCASEGGPDNDPSKVTLSFRTDPEAVKANEEVKLITDIEGLSSFGGLDVNFEIKNPEGKREYIYADNEGYGTFFVPKTFAEAGSYEVIVHLNTPTMHVQDEFMLNVE